jgi:hypothetical protein
MSAFTIFPRGRGDNKESLAYSGDDLCVIKETTSAMDEEARWSGPPQFHLVRLNHVRRTGSGAHLLFRVAVSSLAWDNTGAEAPEGSFTVTRSDGKKVLELDVKGMVVTGFSFIWSATEKSITESLALRTLRLERMRSDLHTEVAVSLLSDIGGPQG